MSGLALIGIPTAAQCLRVLGPVAGLFLFGWVMRQSDHLIRRFLPELEFDRQLGWLNIRSTRRANAFLRWVAYAAYGLLAAALLGILWGAMGVGLVAEGSDPSALREMVDRVPMLLGCAGIWGFYLFGDLLPRLRREYEEEELERYRAECAAMEEAEEGRGSKRAGRQVKAGPLGAKLRRGG